VPGVTVRYLNPLRVKAQPPDTLRRVKTDRVDAVRIARAAQAHPGSPWTPVPEHRTLTRLHRRLVRNQSRIKEELTNLLDTICPEFAEFFPNPFLAGPVSLLERWPDLRAWARLRVGTLKRQIERGSRRPWSPERVEAFRDAVVGSIGSAYRTDATVLALQLLLQRKNRFFPGTATVLAISHAVRHSLEAVASPYAPR